MVNPKFVAQARRPGFVEGLVALRDNRIGDEIGMPLRAIAALAAYRIESDGAVAYRH